MIEIPEADPDKFGLEVQRHFEFCARHAEGYRERSDDNSCMCVVPIKNAVPRGYFPRKHFHGIEQPRQPRLMHTLTRNGDEVLEAHVL